MEPSPPENQIDLWYTRLDKVAKIGLLDQYHLLIGDEESSRARRFVFEKDREQFLVGRALRRTVLSQYCDVPANDWRFCCDKFGKPEIAGPIQLDIAFNMSHTSGWVVCAVARGSVPGVDVEQLGRTLDYTGVAEKFFSKAESEHLLSMTPEQQPTTFFRIWTLKEAFVKACGGGLSMPLANFAVVPTTVHPPTMTLLDDSFCDLPACQFAQVQFAKQVMIGICALGSTAGPMQICLREYIPLQNVLNSVVLPVDRGLLVL